jgi:hypothetical protein
MEVEAATGVIDGRDAVCESSWGVMTGGWLSKGRGEEIVPASLEGRVQVHWRPLSAGVSTVPDTGVERE